MSFENLQLPPALIVELYGNSLVLYSSEKKIPPAKREQTTRKQKETEDKSVKYLGGNKSKVTILISDPGNAFLNDEELSWLEKVLQACKLTLGDVAIVNLESGKQTAASLKQHLAPGKMILLGVEPNKIELPLNFPQFKLQEYDGTTYLYAPSPAILSKETDESKKLKRQFWTRLQELFGL